MRMFHYTHEWKLIFHSFQNIAQQFVQGNENGSFWGRLFFCISLTRTYYIRAIVNSIDFSVQIDIYIYVYIIYITYICLSFCGNKSWELFLLVGNFYIDLVWSFPREKLAPLGIMGAQLGAPPYQWNPPRTSRQNCAEGFQGGRGCETLGRPPMRKVRAILNEEKCPAMRANIFNRSTNSGNQNNCRGNKWQYITLNK